MTSISEKPTPQHWTFRMKRHKLTILIYVDPDDTFSVMRKTLLETLAAAGIIEIDGQTVPSDPEAIILGIAIVKNDPSQGWVNLEIPESDAPLSSALKRKSAAKGANSSFLNSSPRAAGLKDATTLAFAFKGDEVDGEPGWDVVLPTFEDEDES